MSPKRSLTSLALSFVLLLSLFGTANAALAASPLDALISIDAPTDDPGKARVRVVHASPDAPNVDILVNDGAVLTNVPYPAVSDYLAVDPGMYNLKVVVAGTTGPAVIDADVDLAADTYYTVIATDTVANIRPTILVDDLDGITAGGDARVRFFHGSPDAPNVDIVATALDAVVFDNVAFGESRDYISVAAGALDVGVNVAGTDTTVLSRSLDLAPQTNYTVYAIGLLADGISDNALFLQDDRFRVEVTWTDFDGNTGAGFQEGLTDDSGYFYFFNRDNVEIVVKVLDGRPINGNWWVFYGSLSNVGFELTVTDTATGAVSTYTNPVGNFASQGDTEAFPGGDAGVPIR